jgi:hypothetical protein
MEGIGAAASIVAVVDISAKIAGLVFRYTKGVLGAREDATRLYTELTTLSKVAGDLRGLLNSPDGDLLSVSQSLKDEGDKCKTYLEGLQKELDPVSHTSRMPRWMARLHLQDLKWPLKKADADEAVRFISRWIGIFINALQVDQT